MPRSGLAASPRRHTLPSAPHTPLLEEGDLYATLHRCPRAHFEPQRPSAAPLLFANSSVDLTGGRAQGVNTTFSTLFFSVTPMQKRHMNLRPILRLSHRNAYEHRGAARIRPPMHSDTAHFFQTSAVQEGSGRGARAACRRRCRPRTGAAAASCAPPRPSP